MTKREEFTSKYERNLLLVAEFRETYHKYLERTNSWNKNAFFDSRITNRQYYDEIVRISDQEYSAAQHEAIKTINIQPQFLDEYIAGLDNQYRSLSLLNQDIKAKL